MINYIAVTELGEIVSAGVAMTEEEAFLDASSEGQVLCGPEYSGISPNLYYIKDGELKEYPDRPRTNYSFDFTSETWFDPTTLEEMADIVRFKRGKLLVASDWTQVADAPVDQAAWAAYRQELRDVTSQETFPSEVTWPVAP